MLEGRTKALRGLFAQGSFVTLPGIYDCLSARIAEEAGFKAIFLSGGALAYSYLGKPAIGFLNLTDFGNAIQRICNAVSIPLIADADNGFGNAIHAANAARVYEQSGASGMQIDDKVLPSIRPDSNEVLDWHLVYPKISAVRANVSKDFLIIYRTCANLYGYGIEESLKRINLSVSYGADYAYIDGIKSIEELKYVSENARVPLLINLNEKGFCGGLPINEILKYSFSVGLFPISSVSAAAQGMIRVLGELSESGSTVNIRELMTDPPTRVHEMMGEKRLAEQFSAYY